jgi:hypothetical protein
MLAAGVKVRWPAALTAGATANISVLATLQLIVNASDCDSPGPAEMLVAQAALYAPESSATVMVSGPAAKVGGSFTAAAIEM